MRRALVAFAILLSLLPFGAGAEAGYVSIVEDGKGQFNMGLSCDSNSVWIAASGSPEWRLAIYGNDGAVSFSAALTPDGEVHERPRGSDSTDLKFYYWFAPANSAGGESSTFVELPEQCSDPVMPGSETPVAIPTQMPEVPETPVASETPSDAVTPVASETPEPSMSTPVATEEPNAENEMMRLVIILPDGGSLEGSPFELYAPLAAQFMTEPYLEGTVGADNTILLPLLPEGTYRLVIHSATYGTIDFTVTVTDALTNGDTLVINLTPDQMPKMPGTPAAGATSPASGPTSPASATTSSASGSGITGSSGKSSVTGLPSTGSGTVQMSQVLTVAVVSGAAMLVLGLGVRRRA